MKFADFQRNDRRLVILLALENAAEYKANHHLLQRYCGFMGHSVSTDAILTDLQWLQEQELLSIDEQQGVTVAALTVRGLDVANARIVVPGVARPAPKAD
jgi:hypothetical protein